MTPQDDPWYGHRMTDDEIAAFLNEQATGVLSLARGGRAYGIPMSFAYDEVGNRLLMDMGFGTDSKKRRFLEETDEATIATYDWVGPQNWASAIAIGPIRRVSEADIDTETESWYQEVASDIDVAGTVDELTWFELRIDELTGVAVYE